MRVPRVLPRQISVGESVATKLEGDAGVVFNSIMNQWKVFGGRDVPLLLEICRTVKCVRYKAGEYLFEEGRPMFQHLSILKAGELEVSSASGHGGDVPAFPDQQPPVVMTGWGLVTGPKDVLEVISDAGAIISSIMDLLALLCDFKVGRRL
jgi:CRP-like cAMP-binding protein